MISNTKTYNIDHRSFIIISYNSTGRIQRYRSRNLCETPQSVYFNKIIFEKYQNLKRNADE